MNIKQEKFIYARIKDYDKRLKTIEKLLKVQTGEEASPEAGEPVRSSDHQDCQTQASQSLEAGLSLTAEPVTR